MNKSDFLIWFNDFVKKKGGYYPNDISNWYDRVKAKEDKYLNQYPKTINIDLPDTSKTLDIISIRPLIQQIISRIPNYYREYIFSDNIFMFPTFRNGDFKDMSVAKHILTYCKRKQIPQNDITIISNALSHIGQKWAEIKFARTKVNATIESSPLAWSLLGLFGCESYSCFAQNRNSQNPDKKYAFGADPNVFMVLFHNDDIALEEGTQTIIGRMILTMQENIFHFTNGYKFGCRPNTSEFCMDIFQQLTKTKKGDYGCKNNYFLWSGGLTYTDGPVINVHSKETNLNSVVQYRLITDYAKERGIL